MEQFDNAEILPAVKSVQSLSPTDRDQCFIGTYYRAVANVRTTLALNHPKHFQAIAMLARTNIELAMDIRLLSMIPQAPEKMIAGEKSEKLRVAQKIVEFATKSGTAVHDLTTYQTFIANEEANILALRQQLWGTQKPQDHWSTMKVRERAVLLKAPFEELYEIKYRHLSWQVHSGLTGVLGQPAATFEVMCGDAFGIAMECYEQVLDAMITEYQIQKADPKIHNKLKYARVVPFTDGENQRAALERELLG
ncbi:MAG TPA: DUF5677 domain-containing protein [Thermoanaerobaculia bacterium]|nr:DUF5677 domain-containing protein [Thermoanaerobaculia bacterium]